MSAADSGLVQSVKQRLLNRSRQRGEAFNAVLARYAIERLLYRLTKTPHGERFILKGAMLFSAWFQAPHRPTRDVDLLGPPEATAASITGVFREACEVAVEPDGLVFDAATLRVDEIREGQVYHGLRVRLTARLGKARIPVQVDVGLGDVVTPPPRRITFGPMLDLPPPVMKSYAPETVIAEKLEAVVARGLANSRMKDFHDLWWMCTSMTLDGARLVQAVRATFRRRRRDLPGQTPEGLSDAFAAAPGKAAQWAAFARKSGLVEVPPLADVVSAIRAFAGPLLMAVPDEPTANMQWRDGAWR